MVKIIKIGLDSNDSLSGGLDTSNTKLNTDDITDGSITRYEGGVDSTFGVVGDFDENTALPQFPNKFFPLNSSFDSDIKGVVGVTDGGVFINNVGTKKNYANLGPNPISYYTFNVYNSLDSGAGLIDPLNP